MLPNGHGVAVTIGVIDGEEMAKKTLNERLGIIGGISILGTTGIVRPYSTAAFRASVTQAIDVASSLGLSEIVVTTGGRSERYGQALRSDLTEQAFIQMGDFVGHALNRAAELNLRRVTICGMMGKLSKMADGRTRPMKGSAANMNLLSIWRAAPVSPKMFVPRFWMPIRGDTWRNWSLSRAARLNFLGRFANGCRWCSWTI